MNRKNFGLLVKSLRTERRDPDLKQWTMEYLAKMSGLTPKIIESIEYGNKKKINQDELIKLADAFQLSTMERKEFFLGALDLEDKTIARDTADVRTVFEKSIYPLMAEAFVPALLLNCFYDIIAANSMLAAIYGLNPQTELHKLSAGNAIPNILTYLAANKNLHEVVDHKHLVNYVSANLQHFKVASLRYRWKPRYEELLTMLMKEKLIRKVWYNLIENPREHTNTADIMAFAHPMFGMLNYIVTETTFFTNQAEMFLILYVPLSENTVVGFERLRATLKNEVYVIPNMLDKI